MGAGGRVLRALTVALAAAAAAGCVDFVEPVLPERGQAALFQGALRTWADGRVLVDGRLSPGFDDDAVLREVARETVLALNRAIEPASLGEEGDRLYFEQWTTTIDSVGGLLHFEAPALAGLGAPPSLRWSGVTTPQPDTLDIAAGADLLLELSLGGEEPPQPQVRQWLVQLNGIGNLRIGADGTPPSTIVVPAALLPAPANGVLRVSLGYTRSVSLQGAIDYAAILVLDARVEWVVRIAEGAPVQ